jgi:hypothetical protein
MAFIRTPGGLHVSLNGDIRTLASSDPVYGEVVAALARGATDDEILEILNAELRRLEEATHVAPDIVLKGGVLYYKEDAIAGTLGTRMLEMLNEGFNLKPMAALLANIELNPSNKVVTRLYDFLEMGQNPLTEDGCFLAYKAVRPDFKDIHSGNFDNSVGQVLSMPRNRVDERDEVTCSYGFHVCSFSYLPRFSHANGHVMICKVNPADVVSIPTDYNNTKMRVCRYEVIGEYEGYYKNEGDVLSSTTVVSDSDTPFLVEARYSEFEGWEEQSSHSRLVEAAEALEDLLSDSLVFAARLTNVETGVVVQEKVNDDFDDDSGSANTPSEKGFTLAGFRADGSRSVLNSGEVYDDIPSAAAAAWEFTADYSCIQVISQDGDVEMTIT